MKIFSILLISTCLFMGLGSCDDENSVGDAEATAACGDYCQKLFDCGITVPADMTMSSIRPFVTTTATTP